MPDKMRAFETKDCWDEGNISLEQLGFSMSSGFILVLDTGKKHTMPHLR